VPPLIRLLIFGAGGTMHDRCATSFFAGMERVGRRFVVRGLANRARFPERGGRSRRDWDEAVDALDFSPRIGQRSDERTAEDDDTLVMGADAW